MTCSGAGLVLRVFGLSMDSLPGVMILAPIRFALALALTRIISSPSFRNGCPKSAAFKSSQMRILKLGYTLSVTGQPVGQYAYGNV